MKWNPYLNFDGNCAAAFKFYEKCLGGKITMMQTHADSPIAGEVSPEMSDKVLHVRLELGDQVLMGSDAMPGYYQAPGSFYVSIQVEDVAEGERVFKALSENGTVQMPFEKTFWSPGFGMLADQFGTPWMVNCQEG
jgi:PhnB protein